MTTTQMTKILRFKSNENVDMALIYPKADGGGGGGERVCCVILFFQGLSQNVDTKVTI
jgi:hypothetical protein